MENILHLLELKPIHLIVFGVLLLTFAIQIFYYLYFYARILCYNRKIKKGKIKFSDEKPPVSVVICAKNESENLAEFLPAVLNQDYPNYEVIVVNDGSSDETEDILYSFAEKYKNLYHTYIPVGVQHASTKKIALTVGIKAAKNELLILTDADCEPVGKNWISNVVRNFDEKTDIVLSYGAYFKRKGFVGKLVSYDTFLIALQYMGFALVGKPYMGVGRNLAYRKEIFFKNKGFASHLSLQSGDDDLFISEVAAKQNTRVEISPESVTYSVPKKAFKSWYIQKLRHLTTSPYYKKGIKTLIGTEVLSRFFFYLSIVVAIILNNMWLYIAAVIVFILRFIIQLIIINLTAKRINERRFGLSILLFDILLPLINLNIMLFSKKGKRNNTVKW
jgi:glycosyltransferase involved in cell wall biosynthesis